MQRPTMTYGRRPFGVGLLVAGYDEKGPHIYQLCPSANFFDCKCMAIGARSQSARTYLERNLDKFTDSSLSELISHGLRSLRECLPSEQVLTPKNCSVAVVGLDQKLKIYDNEDVQQYLSLIDQSKGTKKQSDEDSMDQTTADGSEDTGDRPEPEGVEKMDTES